MKRFQLFVTLFCTTVMVGQTVGINTTSPRKTLEVGGSMHVTQNTTITKVPAITDTDVATFLIQDDTNSIIGLDPKNLTGAALGYLQEYIIEDMDKDWVEDFDTGISSTDFVLVIISAHFNKQIALIDGDKDKFSMPYTSTFTSGGTWHIIADYPSVANEYDVNDPIWQIKTLIFSKDLSKQFGKITVPMGGSTTGSAISPFID